MSQKDIIKDITQGRTYYKKVHIFSEDFFGHLKKNSAEKSSSKFSKKHKQIIQKFNKSPTQTTIFFKKSPEFIRFFTRFCSNFSFPSKLTLKSMHIREF